MSRTRERVRVFSFCLLEKKTSKLVLNICDRCLIYCSHQIQFILQRMMEFNVTKNDQSATADI